MERHILSEIKCRIKDETCNDSNFPHQLLNCNFLPCEVVTCSYSYPLKIIFPSSISDSCCQWIYPVNFGGGLVEGDIIDIAINISKKCCVVMSTLSYPKVYCCLSGKESKQSGKFTIGCNSLFCVLPDPVVCFNKASYVQTQTFYLESSANLVLLDWFTSGRYERGERWVFSKLKTESTIFMNKKLTFREVQCLQNTPFLTIEKAMKFYNIFGTCMIMGPYLNPMIKNILSSVGRCRNYGEKSRLETIFAVSPLHDLESTETCGCILRFAAESVVEVVRKMEEILNPLFPIIGGNPFENK